MIGKNLYQGRRITLLFVVRIFEKTNGQYGDAAEEIIVVLLPLNSCDPHDMEEHEHEVEEMFEACQEVISEHEHDDHEEGEHDDHEENDHTTDDHTTENPDEHGHEEHECSEIMDGSILIAEEHGQYIHFENDTWYTQVNVQHTGCMAIFAQHNLQEFNAHVLFEFQTGEEATAIVEIESHEDDHDDDDNKPWGIAILANVICIIPSVFALLILPLPQIRTILDRNIVYIMSFVFGVLMATAMIHLYPEGIAHLDYSEYDMSHDVAEQYQFWTSGTSALVAVFFAIGSKFIFQFVGHSHNHDHLHGDGNNHDHQKKDKIKMGEDPKKEEICC